MTTDRYQRQRHKDHIRWLRRLATLAENPISTRLHELDRITAEIAILDGTTCTGRIHWRDQNKPGKTPKMYILHSTDQSCPIHGTPAPGSRIRLYIGTDETKQEPARAAIRREQTRLDLEKHLTGIIHTLQRCGYHITQFYNSLGYTVPRQDQPTLYPEPSPNWISPLTP